MREKVSIWHLVGLTSRSLGRFASCILLLLVSLPATAVNAAELASHRAVYDLALRQSGTSADIANVDGRMLLEWKASSCDGHTLTQRLVTNMSDTDGGVVTSDLRMTSWESANGDEFVFDVERITNGALEEQITGTAERSRGGNEVQFKLPKSAELELPEGIIFPSEFMSRLVASAEDGKRHMSAVVFEGADVDRYFDVSAIIGRASRAETDLSDLADPLATEDSWPVQVGYFVPGDPEGLPDYQVSYRLFANGITTNLLLDYGDIQIDGTLVALELLENDPC